MKKFEPDFSDITGAQSPPVAPKQEVPKKKAQPKKAKKSLSGIVLSIPIEGEDGWLDKDLAECSGAEFAAWALSVWPQFELVPEKLESPGARVELFKRILGFNNALRMHNKPKERPKA